MRPHHSNKKLIVKYVLTILVFNFLGINRAHGFCKVVDKVKGPIMLYCICIEPLFNPLCTNGSAVAQW